MTPDSQNISSFTPSTDSRDGQRPIITFFNPAPEPIMTRKGVNNDLDRRYVDIGTKHFTMIESEFNRVKALNGVTVSDKSINNADPCTVRYTRFGPPRKTAGQQMHSQAYRAYLLISPESAYPALQRINRLGEVRQNEGKHTEYKFRYPTSINERNDRLHDFANRAYQALYIDNPMDAIITLYSDTQEEIIEIFHELVTRFSWDDIERQKIQTSIGINLRKPQKGSERFSSKGIEYLTLEFNDRPGFSETQPRNP